MRLFVLLLLLLCLVTTSFGAEEPALKDTVFAKVYNDLTVIVYNYFPYFIDAKVTVEAHGSGGYVGDLTIKVDRISSKCARLSEKVNRRGVWVLEIIDVKHVKTKFTELEKKILGPEYPEVYK